MFSPYLSMGNRSRLLWFRLSSSSSSTTTIVQPFFSTSTAEFSSSSSMCGQPFFSLRTILPTTLSSLSPSSSSSTVLTIHTRTLSTSSSIVYNDKPSTSSDPDSTSSTIPTTILTTDILLQSFYTCSLLCSDAQMYVDTISSSADTAYLEVDPSDREAPHVYRLRYLKIAKQQVQETLEIYDKTGIKEQVDTIAQYFRDQKLYSSSSVSSSSSSSSSLSSSSSSATLSSLPDPKRTHGQQNWENDNTVPALSSPSSSPSPLSSITKESLRNFLHTLPPDEQEQLYQSANELRIMVADLCLARDHMVLEEKKSSSNHNDEINPYDTTVHKELERIERGNRFSNDSWKRQQK